MSGVRVPNAATAAPREIVDTLDQLVRKDGSFTAGVGASTVIVDINATPNSRVLLTPTNAAAAALGAYVEVKSTRQFTVGHSTAIGTETFDYDIIN